MLVNTYAGTLGVLMPDLSRQFGWSRAELSASVMIICTGLLIVGPVVGAVVDRIGPRRIAVAGSALFCTALACVGFSGPRIWTWYLAWTVVAIVNPMANNLVWTTAINRSFRKRRGLALSIALSGVGIGTSIAPLIAVWSLPIVGWRGTYFLFGLGGLLAAVPIIWYLFRCPQGGGESRATDEPPSHARTTSADLAAILRDSRFWRLLVSVVLVSAGIGTLMIHMQPVMRDAGVRPEIAASYAALVGPAAIAGRLLGGYLLDRLSARLIGAITFALPVIPCAILLHYHASPLLSTCTAVGTGLALGVDGDIVAYITARYLGLRRYGLLYSLIFGCYAFGAGFAPVVAGAIFDAAGSYAIMFKALIGGLLCSAILVATLGAPPKVAGLIVG
jgi:predicted MFS family arabinose efflux permease